MRLYNAKENSVNMFEKKVIYWNAQGKTSYIHSSIQKKKMLIHLY